MSRNIGLDYPVSEAAIPPIRPEHVRHVETALCPQHGSQFAHLNVEGRVYLCPQGSMYWRAGSRGGGMHAQLRWPRGM